jgi:hypothetical protein
MGMTLAETARVASATGLQFERKGLSRLIFVLPPSGIEISLASVPFAWYCNSLRMGST